MIENIKLHWQYVKMRVASRMAYRFDFFVSAFAFFLFQLVAPLFVGVIYYAGGEFPGWTFPQILLLQGALNLVKGLSFMLFFGILWNTIHRVRRGTFDLFLIRPISTLWLLIMESFDEEDVGQLLGGIAVMSVALYLLKGVHGSILMFAIFIIFGILFFLSIALLCSAATIRLVRTHRLYEFVDILMVFAGYPKTVYSKALGIVFSVIFPLFVASYYPASALLGFTYEYGIASMISTIALLGISLLIWHHALGKYQSAGG
jgi:ABC-2 type transport system permease protein